MLDDLIIDEILSLEQEQEQRHRTGKPVSTLKIISDGFPRVIL